MADTRLTPPLFGWVPHTKRTAAQQIQAAVLVAGMPRFRISGPWRMATDKAVLWQATQAYRGGRHLPALYQSVGSCVGHGKAKCEWYLEHVQVVTLGLPQTPILPYEPYGYAQSRVCAGISGGEDGSTGSGAAEAARVYGILRADFAKLPAPEVEDGTDTLRTPGTVDRSWGQSGSPEEDVSEGKKQLVRTTAPVSTPDDVVAAISNGYPCTIASSWGGLMQCPTAGSPPVLMNHHADVWPHQMMVSGFWAHPTLGRIFHIDNSWGADAHGANPDGAPPGGFWVSESDMSLIVAEKDSYAYSSFDGFPAASPTVIPWIFSQ